MEGPWVLPWNMRCSLTLACLRRFCFVVPNRWFPRENSHWDLLGTWTGKHTCLFLFSLWRFHPGKVGCCNGNPRFMFSLNSMNNLILFASMYISPSYQTICLNKTKKFLEILEPFLLFVFPTAVFLWFKIMWFQWNMIHMFLIHFLIN